MIADVYDVSLVSKYISGCISGGSKVTVLPISSLTDYTEKRYLIILLWLIEWRRSAVIIYIRMVIINRTLLCFNWLVRKGLMGKWAISFVSSLLGHLSVALQCNTTVTKAVMVWLGYLHCVSFGRNFSWNVARNWSALLLMTMMTMLCVVMVRGNN